MERRRLTVDETSRPRLDRWLAGAVPELSRARLQGLIEDGHVRVDGLRRKPSHRLAPGEHVEIERTPTDDNRSYQISSAKIERILGFRPQRTIEDAIRDLVAAFDAGTVPDSFDDPRWFNIKMMQTSPLPPYRSSRL